MTLPSRIAPHEADCCCVLSYRDYDDGSYWFVPTDPPSRKWRGPFQNEYLMQRAIKNELGDGTTETRTAVRPELLK